MGIIDSTEKIEKIKSRLDKYQYEYFDILQNLGDEEDLADLDFHYEKLKQLQLTIFNLADILRELQLQDVTSSLSEAVTPKLKSMLSDEIRLELEEDNE